MAALASHSAWPHWQVSGEVLAAFSQRGLQYFLPSDGGQLHPGCAHFAVLFM